MVTHHPVTCWTSCCRSRRTHTLGLDQPPLALWALGQDRDRDRDQDVTAVGLQRVEPLAAEQVSRQNDWLFSIYL